LTSDLGPFQLRCARHLHPNCSSSITGSLLFKDQRSTRLHTRRRQRILYHTTDARLHTSNIISDHSSRVHKRPQYSVHLRLCKSCLHCPLFRHACCTHKPPTPKIQTTHARQPVASAHSSLAYCRRQTAVSRIVDRVAQASRIVLDFASLVQKDHGGLTEPVPHSFSRAAAYISHSHGPPTEGAFSLCRSF
jgi:hypothetical protein